MDRIEHDRLNQILKQGENSAVEFKEGDVRPESLAKEIVSFANSYGGVILIGVADDGSIRGVDSDRSFDEWVTNIARNNIQPPVQITTEEHMIEGKKIVEVTVEKGRHRPYQDNSGRFYVRVGSTNRMASLQELMHLFQEGGFYHFDKNEVEEADHKSLARYALSDYFQAYGILFEELDEEEQMRLLKNTDILGPNGHPTVAGLMIFGSQPQRYLHNASISYAHYAGVYPDEELIDRQSHEGTLPRQVESAVLSLRNNLRIGSTIIGTKRVEHPHYPEKVFRELIVNACMHRNYSISGSRIRILQFSNRIEFLSPGKLPNTVTTEKLSSGVSFAVNPVIVKFMENLRFTDKLGRGLPMVWREGQKLGKEVRFEEIGEEFRVTLEL